MIGHWEIYISKGRTTGETPWAIVEGGKDETSAIFVSDIVIKTRSYSGKATHKDRSPFVIHCFGVLRHTGNLVVIEEPPHA